MSFLFLFERKVGFKKNQLSINKNRKFFFANHNTRNKKNYNTTNSTQANVSLNMR